MKIVQDEYMKEWEKLQKKSRKPKEPSVEVRYREKPHRFEVKDQRVIIRLRKWQNEMLYDEFTDTELLILITKEWIDRARSERGIPIEAPRKPPASGQQADSERITSG